MIKKLPFILVLCLCVASANATPMAFTVLGYDIKPYQEAVKGFESTGPPAGHPYVLSDNKGLDVLERIRRNRPDIIIPIGLSALSSVSGIEDIPIVYMMVPESISGLPHSKNATGVGMNVDPDVVFDIVTKTLPDVKKYRRIV